MVLLFSIHFFKEEKEHIEGRKTVRLQRPQKQTSLFLTGPSALQKNCPSDGTIPLPKQ